MPQINNFPGGFAAGLTIRGLPIAVTHPGKIFWVSNATTLSDRQIGGSDGNKGTFDAPMATIGGALAQCVANRGDVILVKPGHAETISAAGTVANMAAGTAINLNKAGVAIIGLGTGTKRPTLTWSAAASTIEVSASNVTLSNFLCISTMATGFTTTAFAILTAVVANDFTLDNCEFRDSSSTTGFLGIITQGGTTSLALDGLTVNKCKRFSILSTVTNVTAFVVLTGAVTDRMTLTDNFIVQNTAHTAAQLASWGANNVTNALIARNITQSKDTSNAGSLLQFSGTACNGIVRDNRCHHLVAGGVGLLCPLGSKFGFAQNWCGITGTADKNAAANPLPT